MGVGYDRVRLRDHDHLRRRPEQCEQTLRNLQSALKEAGAEIGDVVRVRYILPRAEDFPACWPVLRRWFGEVRPAATMFVAGLADPRMKIEIEADAHVRAR
jgi:enamine deaminase RidA (YjgF/YER057c/UK114 family)